MPDGKPDTWTEEQCGPAFESIANLWPYERLPGVAVTAPTVLMDVGLSRVEFMAWVTAKRYEQPRFWGPFPKAAPAFDQLKSEQNVMRRRRGRDPKKRIAVVAQMRAEIAAGVITPQQLADLQEDQLAARYGDVSRDTARKGRNELLGWK